MRALQCECGVCNLCKQRAAMRRLRCSPAARRIKNKTQPIVLDALDVECLKSLDNMRRGDSIGRPSVTPLWEVMP